MTLFNTKTIVAVDNIPTTEEAQTIYSSLKAGKNETDLFKEGIAFEKTAIVVTEMKSLESEMVSKMQGSYLLEEAVKNEEGEITTPPVYFIVTTETALKESMSSDLLDTDILVEDVRIWSDGNPDKEPSWVDYKKLFVEE